MNIRHSRTGRIAAASSAVVATGAVVAATMLGANGATTSPRAATGDTTHANLEALNNSGANGVADVTVDGRKIEVDLQGRHLLKGMPHAEHIHFGAQAAHECPTVRDDDNHDHRLNTAEGLDRYGPVKVSLTTKGDTSPKSTLAVKRFPTAPKGTIDYSRTITVSKKVARGIRRGEAVLVIHGIDYNGNGRYDFSAGRSELDPSLPAEATDPALCGVLKVVKTPAAPSSTPSPTASSSPGLPLGLRQQR